MDKKILLASFIFPERIDWFVDFLNQKFNIKKENVFCYKILDDDSKFILTFRLTIPEGQRLNLKEIFPNAVSIHKKGETLYTINALNKLIESTNTESIGNLNYKNVKIDWSSYQNKMMIINNNELTFLDIKRVF
jgi:hypothetical protein